jgi:hypothetical protein
MAQEWNIGLAAEGRHPFFSGVIHCDHYIRKRSVIYRSCLMN